MDEKDLELIERGSDLITAIGELTRRLHGIESRLDELNLKMATTLQEAAKKWNK